LLTLKPASLEKSSQATKALLELHDGNKIEVRNTTGKKKEKDKI